MATITGTSGNDNALTGTGSDDTIDGLSGVDVMTGGAGNDSYYVDATEDQVVELSGQGTDSVYASINYQLADHVENLFLSGFADIEGIGNSLANTLTGNAGNNNLSGRGGNDTLNGGLGNDTAVYSGASAGYRIGLSGGKFTVADTDSSNGTEGTDTLSEIEQIAFSDGVLSVSRLYTEFRVNTHTTYDQSDPSVSQLADGGFIVTWVSDSQDGNFNGIYAQRYSMDGSASGPEFRINKTTATPKTDPHVTALTDGGFVVTWISNDSDDNGVFAQRYDADGTARGDESRVNTFQTDAQDKHSIAALGDGGFVIAWTSLGEDGSVEGIYAQRYDAEGDAAGISGFRVNSEVANAQYAPSISSLADGGFIISWASNSQDGSSLGIYAQRYDASGTAEGAEFRINNTTAGGQYAPSIIGLSDGGFVATWTSTDGSGEGIYTRVYDADGNTTGADVLVNATTTNNQSNSRTAALEDGGYIVTWSSSLLTNDGTGIYARLYDADGSAKGSEFLVGTRVQDSLTVPSVASLKDGGFIISWQSESAIYAQRYGIDGSILYSVTGDGGNNTLSFISGSANMEGGLGSDSYIVDDAGDTAIENYNAGTDTVLAAVNYTLTSNLENLTLTGSASISGSGNSLNNTITGNIGANTLSGGGGNDTLDGGAGNDTLRGGLGNDTYVIGSGTDTLFENSNAGTDTVRSAVVWTLGSNFENLVLNGSANVNATGNSLNNTITGNSGNNTLNGAAGNDTLSGGLGNDIYLIDSSTDILTENLNQGTDTVQSFVTWTLGNNFENLILAGTAVNATGNALNNVLTGNNSNNTLNGGAGKDALKGGLGNDTYVIDTTTDTLIESANQGTDTVQSSANWTLGNNFENLVLAGSAALKGTGNALNNALTGNSGSNILTGGLGNDTLTGAAGNDTLLGGAGIDTLVGGTGKDVFRFDTALNKTSNIDKLTDFRAVDDTIQLENAIFKKLSATGTLKAANFKANTSGKAADANDYIVYETDSGKLFYDADGNGNGAAIQFALIGSKPVLTTADFIVI